MHLMAALKKPVQIIVAASLLVFGSVTTAETIEDKPSAGAMIIDAVLARPLYFLLSQGGALVYGATLPFTLLGGNADEAAEALVVTPLQAAFVRCLGCGKIDNEVGRLEEGQGKRIHHFVMGSVGQTSFEQTGRADNEKPSGDTISGGLFLGTHFSLSDKSRFDVLVGYRSLGTVKAKSANTKYDATMKSIQIASRFGKRVYGVDIMGKLGMHSWNLDAKITGSPTTKVSGKNFFFGIGVEKFVTRDVRVGLQHDRYSLKDGEFKSTVSTTDLNVSYMF